MSQDIKNARKILDAVNCNSAWVYIVTPTKIGYVCIDTTRGCEYVLLDDLSTESIALLDVLAAECDTLSAEELEAHAASAILDELTEAGASGVYTVDIVRCTEERQAYYFGYWRISGYMDRSFQYGPYATATKLAKEMANFWNNE